MQHQIVMPGQQEQFSMPATTMQQTESSRAMAEVQAAIALAKRFPRDVNGAIKAIQNSCTRKTLAEAAVYGYNRGGTYVTGASIDLLKVVAQQWGNLQFGIRELDRITTGGGGESIVEAFAWDMESNVRETKVFTVAHRRDKSGGQGAELTSERDIYEMVANMGARRMRACLEGVIPGDIIEMAVEKCTETLNANTDVSPEGIKALMVAFAGIGVSQPQVLKFLGVNIDGIRPAQVVNLRKIYKSIKEGLSTPEDWFKPDPVAGTSIQPGKAAERPSEAASAEQPAEEAATAAENPFQQQQQQQQQQGAE